MIFSIKTQLNSQNLRVLFFQLNFQIFFFNFFDSRLYVSLQSPLNSSCPLSTYHMLKSPPSSWLGYRGWNMHISGSLFQSAACILLPFWETAPSFSSLRQNLPCMSPCTIFFPCCLCLTLAYPFPLFPLCWGSSYLKLLKSLQMHALLSNSSSMDSQHWNPQCSWSCHLIAS